MKSIAIIVLMILSSNDAHALKIEDLGLELMYLKSEVIMIGKVVKIDGKEGVALVVPSTLLKGKSKGSYLVRFKTGIMEHTVDCCDVGRGYMFFLVNEGSDIYRSTNGKFGIYPIALPN